MADDPQVPRVDVYSDAVARRLLARLDQLSTFSAVEAWDREAQEEITRMHRHLERLAQVDAKAQAALQEARESHGRRSFLHRTLSTPKGATELTGVQRQITAARQALESLTEQLQSGIDKSPNTPQEQKEMLAELRLIKKELTQQKREVGEAMRQIRTATRQQSAKVGTGIGLLLSTPRSRRYERMGIRIQKESSLASHEEAKTSIERQLLVVERAILWVQRFRSGNIDDQEPGAPKIFPKFEELSVTEQQAALARGEYPGHKPLPANHIGMKKLEQARKAGELLTKLTEYRKLRKEQ